MCIACNRGLSIIAKGLLGRRDFMAGGLAMAASAAHPAAAAEVGGPADVIFYNGPILTMNDHAPRAQAVAIRGERILTVGSTRQARVHASPRTRMIDLKGRTLMPGFIDPHMHMTTAQFDDWLNVSPMRLSSFEQVMETLRAGVACTPPGDWVRAQGFDRATTKGGRALTLAELDALAPNHPVFVVEINGHIAYVNSRALELAQVSRDTPNPPNASFERDANGDLTGRLDEGGAYVPFLMKMPVVTATEMQARLGRLFEAASKVGCTTLHDCGIGSLGGERDLRLMQAAAMAGPPVRMRGMLATGMMKAWTRLDLKPGFGDDRFRVEGIKIVADGSNPGRTGCMREPYLGTDSRGAMNYTSEALTQEIRQAHDLGWQVGVHANGDAAIDAVIDAFETVLRHSPRADHRHRLEHCSLLHPEQITRMRRLGLSPSFLIGHVRWWGKAFRDEFLGPQRSLAYDPCASALRGGLRISLHSDYGVTPLEPLRYVEDAVARVMADGGEVLNAAECIPASAALKAVTLDAAWQCRMNHLVGSLEPGKYADLVVLEGDPTSVSPTEIKAIPVSETWLSGEKRNAA